MQDVVRKKDKGVSAIVGTILIVAITVVLAATVYGVLTGFGGLIGGSAPTASMTVQRGGTSTAPTYLVSFTSVSANLSTTHLEFKLLNSAGTTIAVLAGSLAAGTAPTAGYYISAGENTGGFITVNTQVTITGVAITSSTAISSVQLVDTSPSGTVATASV